MKKDESEGNKLIDWIFGPDIELLRNPKTRKNTVLCIISFLLVCLSFLVIEKPFPISLIPLGPVSLTLYFGSRLYSQADELIRDVTKTAAALTLVGTVLAVIVQLSLFQLGLPEPSTKMLLLFISVFFMLIVVILFKTKM